MVLLRENIDILLGMVLPCLLEPQCISNIRMNHLDLLCYCIISYPFQFHRVSLLYNFFLIMFLIIRLLEYLVVLTIVTLDHITTINLPFGLYNVHFQVIASLINVTSVQTPLVEFSCLECYFVEHVFSFSESLSSQFQHSSISTSQPLSFSQSPPILSFVQPVFSISIQLASFIYAQLASSIFAQPASSISIASSPTPITLIPPVNTTIHLENYKDFNAPIVLYHHLSQMPL